MRFGVGIAAVVLVGVHSDASWASTSRPSLDERVTARRAVEDVLWRHRLWPEGNAQPKPPLSAVLSDAEIRARVVDDLRKSKALEGLWHRPVTAAMLQAELDRMAAASRAPEVLAEMLAAVGNDPVLAREAIARPALADRLLRSWYAQDARYHGAQRLDAERERGGESSEVTWDAAHGSLEERLERIADEEDAYRRYRVIDRGDAIRVAVTSWPKRPFDAFWSENASSFMPDLDVPAGESAPRIPTAQGSCADDTWRPLGNVTPGARYAHTAVWTGSEMIVWGGWTAAGATATGGRYVPATDAWFPIASAGAPPARLRHDAVWTGTQMIVWGGQQDEAGPYVPLGDGARYAPLSDTWTPVSGIDAPSPRREASMVWAGSVAIVFGGHDGSAYVNTGSRYDPATDLWSAITTSGAPSGRAEHTAVWAGSRMFVWGGRNSSFELGDGSRYDPASDTWQPVSGAGAPLARKLATAVWTGSQVLVWGGCRSSTAACYDDGGRYDPSADTWSSTSIEGAPLGRQEHTATWTGSRMIVFGGSDVNGNDLDSGARYDPAADSWAATSLGPERRHLHSAVWSGSEVIVWGGVWEIPHPGNFIQHLDNGGRYSPASDSWVPTSIYANGPPAARAGHTAVWTGAETIFWGGSGVGNGGGRYVSATDAWFPTATSGAPSARSGHTAVWTGAEMIVWGGYDVFFVPFGSGGRYNPASDSWTTTSTATAPPAVAFHTAVWTGSRMLVWGGKHAANNLTSQGGRYDPASDTWSATILAGAPTGRFGHTAVWTGSRMVIWGGTEIDDLDGVGVNTGARYDPVNDAWSATETSTAPTGRSWHTAVWTGQQMLVWGGTCCGNGALLIDGSRYEPLTNTWLAMTLTEAPAGRRYATAVWTGLEMIVWGGTGAGSRENTGGRYSLADDAWTSTTILGAPAARDVHTGTWAGDRMIVFGGNGAGGWPLASGGSYCACITLYQDADGDGWGGPLVALASCDGTIPPGYTLTQSDCNDGNTAIHPGALDSTCNGVDEDCNGYNDDLWIGGLSQCGLGVCHATGFFECINGQIVNNCTPGTPLDLFDINCNNLDEDCDGGVDEEYAQREDLWTPIASAPNTRTKHTTVWTGTEMIVFGGDNGSGTVKVGGEAYAPASNTWRGLAAGPLKRWRHTAVWTGSRMIVWGGDDNVATIYNTGSRYDPSTDTWAATTTTGAPAARLLHTAVWTGNGSRMVIWGGRDAMNFLGTGSRYDPVANSWSATTTTGAPAARWLHSAVWTGTEMIVWGGQATGALNSGSRYDPAGNTWTAVASAGSFAGRFGHVAVWTGTEMLVWGGTDGTSYFGNGGRYNPGTNSWSSMSSIGAPSQRAFASAVWTGSELIVWGGVDGTGGGDALEDGARYDPATNTWTDMSPVSAPNDRGRASGVWTDSELIVWGGDPNGNALGDGARYKPLTLCGTGGCQRTGSMVCSAGVASFQCLPQAPAPEVCNGLDDDCNVAIDDGIPVPSGHPVLILGKLASPSNASFSWDAVPGATGYDVVRGYLSTLRITGGDFTWAMQSCAFNDLAGTVMQDNVPPFPDDGYWYLVRAVNACSGNGTYDDVLPPQQGSRDAEINAAPNTCP